MNKDNPTLLQVRVSFVHVRFLGRLVVSFIVFPLYIPSGHLPVPHGWQLNKARPAIFPLRLSAITTSRKQSDELYAFHETYSGIFFAGSTYS